MNMSTKSSGGSNQVLDLLKRVKQLETQGEDHETRIAELEGKINDLKNALSGASSGGNEEVSSGAPADSGKLNLRLNLLQEELSRKADKTELQHQATVVQAKIDDVNDNINRL